MCTYRPPPVCRTGWAEERGQGPARVKGGGAGGEIGGESGGTDEGYGGENGGGSEDRAMEAVGMG